MTSHDHNGSPGSGRPSRQERPDFIGRDNELELLIQAVTTPPTLTIVEGEAGIGKTRLVRHLLESPALQEVRTLVGHCHPLRSPFPLGAVIEALRTIEDPPPTGSLSAVVGAVRPWLPELDRSLPRLPPPLDDPQAERHRLFRGLRELLGALGPTLCVLEDLDRADEETLEFLQFLTAQQPETLALVVTCRPEDASLAAWLQGLLGGGLQGASRAMLELSPLSCRDVQRLACALLGSDEVSEEFARALYERTGGLPFAVEEIGRLLPDRCELWTAGRSPGQALDELPLPRALSEAVGQRLAGLTADARRIASAAAVLAEPAREDVLSDVAGLSTELGAKGLADALVHRLLEERRNATYGFRQPLVARAAYEAIAGPQRRRLHLRAARALISCSQPQPLAKIASHLREAGHTRWPRYAEAAAKAASSDGDDRLAARMLEEALGAPDLRPAARIRMALALGRSALFSDTPHTAIGLLRGVMEHEQMTSDTRGELRFYLSRLLGHSGDAAWRKEAVRAVDELRARPQLAVRAMVNLARPRGDGEGEPDEHLAWVERARATAQQADLVAQIAVSAQRAAILLSFGDPNGWSVVREIPRSVGGREAKIQLLRGYHALAVTALGLGHYRHAESFFAEARSIQAQLDSPVWELWLATLQAGLDWVAGKWHGLEARVGEILPETAALPVLLVSNELTLGSVLLACGERPEAHRRLRSALERARQSRLSCQLVSVTGQLARLHMDDQDPEAARQAAAVGLDVVRRTGNWAVAATVAPEAAQALVACGDLAAARTLVDDFGLGLHGRDAPAARAALAWCSATVAEAHDCHDLAERQFAQAEQGWARVPNRHEAARARERRAGCIPDRQAGRRDELLRQARETFKSLGAERDATRVEARLKATHVSRRGRRGYGNRLSPREVEVARLAGLGRSNREIAEALLISPRTVEAHVAAALRKLSLPSRHLLGVLGAVAPNGKDQ